MGNSTTGVRLLQNCRLHREISLHAERQLDPVYEYDSLSARQVAVYRAHALDVGHEPGQDGEAVSDGVRRVASHPLADSLSAGGEQGGQLQDAVVQPDVAAYGFADDDSGRNCEERVAGEVALRVHHHVPRDSGQPLLDLRRPDMQAGVLRTEQGVHSSRHGHRPGRVFARRAMAVLVRVHPLLEFHPDQESDDELGEVYIVSR